MIATFAEYVEKHPDDSDLDLLKASHALSVSFGDAAKYIWAVGLLAAGQSSTMTGTYAGQFVMEGFLDFQLPVYQRVLLTRSIAIIPALCVTFFDFTSFTNLDNWLNILQSVQLPFALVPTIKFVSDRNIMGDFAISLPWTIFASIFGFGLFVMNFVIIFLENSFTHTWQYFIVIVFAVIYSCLILNAILEKTSPLKQITDKDMEDHEYERIEIPDYRTSSYVSQQSMEKE